MSEELVGLKDPNRERPQDAHDVEELTRDAEVPRARFGPTELCPERLPKRERLKDLLEGAVEVVGEVVTDEGVDEGEGAVEVVRPEKGHVEVGSHRVEEDHDVRAAEVPVLEEVDADERLDVERAGGGQVPRASEL